MATVQRFEDLKIWQSARVLENNIFQSSQQGSFSKDFELKNQISRSSGSVMDNIAEGFGRGSRAEFIQFLGYSLGSNNEVKSQLYRAVDRRHIDQQQFNSLYNQADCLTKMMATFLNYLKRTTHRGLRYNTNDKSLSIEEPLIEYSL